MDREKVVRDLRYLKSFGRVSNNPQITEIAENAIALLKEQEAVKPVQHLVYTTKGWFCGACNGRLNRLGKYCSFCGRSVKWDA